MSLVLNMVGGGSGGSGPSASDAILTVTVATGSTVTITKGGVTLTPTMWAQAADPTLDCALFIVAPNLFDAVNAWTVTATLPNNNTITGTVVIDTNKQYYLRLVALYFISDGVKVGNNPFSVYGGSGEEFTDMRFVAFRCGSLENTVFYTNNVVDLTSFNTLYVNIPHASFRYYLRFGVATAKNSSVSGENPNPFNSSLTIGTLGEVTNINSDRTVSLDLTSLSGNYYLGFTITYTSDGVSSPFKKGGFAVKKLYLV